VNGDDPDDDALHPARHLTRGRAGHEIRGPAGRARRSPVGDSWIDEAAASATTGAAGGYDRAPPVGNGSQSHRPGSWSRRTTLATVLGLAVAVGAASTAVALLEQSHPAALVSAPAIQALSPADGIGNLRMFGESTGWAQRVSDRAVLHTTQGVQRWTVASPATDEQLVAVAYVTPSVARALTVPQGSGGDATLQAWSTQDGGTTWDPEGTLGVQGFSASIGGALDFVDGEHGWFSQLQIGRGLSGTVLFRTVDAGAHWTEVADTSAGVATAGVALPQDCSGMTATFISTSTGWLTGTCQAASPPFYVTHDGGLTWAVETLAPLPTGSSEETSFLPTFTSALDGVVLTENNGGEGATTSMFATVDGGHSWQLRSTSVGVPLAVDSLDRDHSWLMLDADGVGSDPDVFVTGDGGSTWMHLNAFPYAGFTLDFVTPEMGWAAPDLGELDGGPAYLLQTIDGGRTWTAEVPRVTGASPAP